MVKYLGRLGVFWGLLGLLAALSGQAATAASDPKCAPLLRHSFDRLQDEKPQSLCQYSGKVLLVVNTASFCGITGQYRGLEALHTKYQAQGLVVLGFPSNDFSQESGSNREIAEFCENTFGVKFPMFTKTSVSGPQAVPFFQQLAALTDQKPRWNFYKYLVSREGRAVKAYTSMSGPDDKALVRDIERLLAQPAPKP